MGIEMETERRTFLGGSEAAAALGMSRWQTPLSLWAEKTGQVVPDDISDKLYIKLGNKLESVVAELFEEETGKKVRRVNEMLTHPKYPFLCAHLDRKVVGEDSILEIKTASAWKAREWGGEEIPTEYQLQVMHYLAVSGRQRGYIACLIGGNQKFVLKTIERDEAAIKQLVEKEVHFWNTYVVPKVMPGIITWADADVLFKLYPMGQQGEPIQLTDKANVLLESIQSMQQDYGTLEGQIDQAKNELKAMLGDNTEGRTPQWIVTWKNQQQTRLDMDLLKKEDPATYAKFAKTSQMRVLRYRENKDEK